MHRDGRCARGELAATLRRRLTESHLEAIFALAPQLVLLGTGATQKFPATNIRAAFAQRRIGLEVMDVGAACRTFNLLVQEGRRVAAALLLA